MTYSELAVTTNFSFLRGASHPEELVMQAKALGLAGLGIADRNTVAGVVRAHVAAKQAGLKLAVGARLMFADGTPDILAYPQDRAAWGRLTRLLSVGKRRTDKGECILNIDDLLEHIVGLNLVVMPGDLRAQRASKLDEGTLRLVHDSQAPLTRFAAHPLSASTERATLRTLRSAAPDAVWLAASMLYRGDDARRLAQLKALAVETGVPLIAVGDVLYHVPERRPLQDVVTCIREHVTIDHAGRRLEANAERHLKSQQEMARLFRAAPNALAETMRLLERCRFSLDELKSTEYPDETRRGYATPQDALVAFAEDGVCWRYPYEIPAKVRHALNEELRLIGELGYAPFFLTVHEIVRFTRQEGILCQGRGSAANSVICYCLGITEVDPDSINLLFERFVSAERREPPDIDVDFEHERREEVIQHIYRQYGRERAGLAATVICYRGRSAIREVGKAFGLSGDTIGALAGTLWGWSMQGVTENEARRVGLDPADARLARVIALARELNGFPRHLSQHVGGFVITRSRLDEVVPIENAAMEDRTVIEWDKDDLNEVGLLKVDVLGLGMLSCLRRSFALLRTHYGETRTLSQQDEDPAVYNMIQRADTIGVFQIESRAQMSMLPRLRPKEFYDLVIEVAIVRPGPIQGDMVHPYLRRRQKLEPVNYESAELEEVLKRTLGVPLFQEQAMRIAIVAAGFTPAEADKLRRAMATFKRVGTIAYFRDKLIDGMVAKGYRREFAERCFSQIEGFGEYGFPESHAASFANLVYASAWIKCRYPDVFAAALLNSQPMGFYAPAQIVRDAQDHGVEIRPVDVNFSCWDCTLESMAETMDPLPRLRGRVQAREARREGAAALHPCQAEMRHDIRTARAVRLGFRQISGASEDQWTIIEQVRGTTAFDSIRDFWLRTRLPPAALERLAAADAFRSLGLDRRAALWAVRALRRTGDKDDLPLFAAVAMPELEPDAALPPMPLGEHVVEDYRHLHLSLKAHPVSFLRGELERRGIVRHERLGTLPSGRVVTVAGLVLVRQRPGSAQGVIFMTLEDETGIANTIVWPKVFEIFRPVVLGARLISVTGKLQNEQGVIHVVANRLDDLSHLLRRLAEATFTEALAHVDEVRRPIDDRTPRQGARKLAQLIKEEPALLGEFTPASVAGVMPKGRNFH
jgi:error-prone DNA polymerase